MMDLYVLFERYLLSTILVLIEVIFPQKAIPRKKADGKGPFFLRDGQNSKKKDTHKTNQKMDPSHQLSFWGWPKFKKIKNNKQIKKMDPSH